MIGRHQLLLSTCNKKLWLLTSWWMLKLSHLLQMHVWFAFVIQKHIFVYCVDIYLFAKSTKNAWWRCMKLMFKNWYVQCAERVCLAYIKYFLDFLKLYDEFGLLLSKNNYIFIEQMLFMMNEWNLFSQCSIYTVWHRATNHWGQSNELLEWRFARAMICLSARSLGPEWRFARVKVC